jgi:hypothetical protein
LAVVVAAVEAVEAVEAVAAEEAEADGWIVVPVPDDVIG